MNRHDLIDALELTGACGDAVHWVRDTNGTPAQLWLRCPRADWMLWIAASAGVDRKALVLAACDCAETTLRFVRNGEDRPRLAIEAARRWARGDKSVSLAYVRRAADAAWSAAAAAARSADAAAAWSTVRPADAAARSAAAAAWSAWSADAALSADAAARSAVAAAWSAWSAAYAAHADADAAAARNQARAKAHRQCATLVRRHIGWREVVAGLEKTRKAAA